jgi:hypothetical protein
MIHVVFRGLLTLLVLAALAATAVAQESGCLGKGVPSDLFDEVLAQTFSRVVQPKAGSALGNHASVDLKDAAAEFGMTTRTKGGSILAFTARGSASDGVLPLLRGSELNSELALGFQYHGLALGDQSLDYNLSSADKYCAMRRLAEAAEQQRRAQGVRKFLEQTHDRAVLRLEARVSDLRTRSAEIRAGKHGKTTATRADSLFADSLCSAANPRSTAGGKLQATPSPAFITCFESELLKLTPPPTRLELLIADSLDQEAARLDTQRLDLLAQKPTENQVEIELSQLLPAELKKLSNIVEVTGFNLHWWSFGYRLSNATFKLFDAARPYGEQLEKRSYMTHEVSVQYSRYKFSNDGFQSYFVSLGASLANRNNLAELSKVELTDTRDLSTIDGQRRIDKRTNAFEGAYHDDLTSAALSGNLYWFVLQGNRTALHIYPTITGTDGVRPVTDIGIGFVSVFRKHDKPDSKLNAELFWALTDLTNVRQHKDSPLERGTIGLRFTFPINFNGGGGS